LIRTALALSLAVVVVLGGGDTVANAQSASSSPQVPARFTATVGEGSFNDQTATTVAIVEASDARISGTWNETTGISVSQLVDGASEVITVWWHDITILNATGSWVGHSEGFGQAPDFDSAIAADSETIFLVGRGGYEGWTATLLSTEGQARGPGSLQGGSFEGVIFPPAWNPVVES
jgi:hypothetical protein